MMPVAVTALLVGLMYWGGLPSAVWADTVEHEKTVMDEVVVTASREKEPAAKVPAHVTLIDSQTIEKSTAKNVPEVLAQAGLQVSDIGGNQRNYVVDMRGFGEIAAMNLLVMVDGRRINQPDLSASDWTLIPLERIARIEVLPGSRGSVLYGDNATGGVINIITKEGAGREGFMGAQYGSYETFKGSAGISGAEGLLSFGLTASYFDTDGYRDNSDIDAKDAGLNLRFDPTEKTSLDISSGYHREEAGLPGAILQSQFAAGAGRTDSFHPGDFVETEDYYVKTGGEFFFLTDDAFRIDLSYRNRDVEQFASITGGYFTGQTSTDTVAVSPRLTFQEDWGGVSNRIIIGADFSKSEEEIENFSSFTGQSDYKLEKENYGYFVHDDLDITSKLTLSGGYRRDEADFSFSSGSQDDRDYDEEAFTSGINYRFEKIKLHANYGKTFRYPALDEIFNFIDNSATTGLQPQTSHNLEIGARFELAAGFSAALNLFRIETEDEIFYNPAGGPFGFGANENLDGDTIRNGLELQLTYARKGWSTAAGYTYTDAEIDGGIYDHETVPNVPTHRANASLGYSFGMGLYLGLNAIYTGERYLISDFNNAYEKQDDYTVVNAKVGYDWRWLAFFVNLNNLLDKEYASYAGLNWMGEPGYYPSPEFNVLAGVTARFGRK